ncbi:MAG: Hypoxanthine-guanine phosphoribosyltransferase [Chloroflexi bacterium ADurb.Bin325]|nr:MAG: Hypoxanthine-guanine phosphoribosyltransferase [Chloroflexi bacterium ADurb.Bin325]
MNHKPMDGAQDDARAELARGTGRTVYSEAEIRGKVAELAAAISRDYAGLNPIVVGVLKGVIFFMSDLLRAITIPVRADFIAISRYSAQQKIKGPVRLIKDLDENVEGQHILFVEDVIDTGLTLSYLLRLLRARGPASLEVCTLFDKPQHRLADIRLRYKGFDLPDRFVVGYGLDYREAYRHLPYVAELTPEVLKIA